MLFLPWPYNGSLENATAVHANLLDGALSNKIADATEPPAKASFWLSDHHLPVLIDRPAGSIAPKYPSSLVVRCAAPHAVFLATDQET